MTQKSRKTLFFVSLLLFLVGSPLIIMYSLGYKLDIKNLTLQKSGGLFVKTEYKNYDIIINNKLEKTINSSIFSEQGVLIPNLAPKSYKIKIEKTEYLPWEKSLQIKSGMVTEVKNIFLVPNSLEESTIETDVINYSISSSQKKIAIIKNASIMIIDIPSKEEIEISNLRYKDTNNLKILSFSKDDKNLFLEYKKSLLRVNLEDESIDAILSKENYTQIKASLVDSNLLYAIKGNNLYEIDFKASKQTEIVSGVSNFYISDKEIFYTTISPINFYKKKIDSKKTSQITFNPLKGIDSNSKIITRFNDPIALLNKQKELMLFDYSTESFKKLASDVNDAIISNDLSKILYRKNNELYIYYLVKTYPQKKSGKINLIGRFGDKIQDVFWLTDNNNYIFLEMSGKLTLTELDDRGKRNSYTILNDARNIKYSNGFIYFMKDNKLQKISLIEK